jgi:hypothetical protein
MTDLISDRLCDNCNAPLLRHERDGGTQYDNALIITVSGGYGMFVEVPMMGGPDENLIICHDCAHRLCFMFPAFNDLIDPARSHTHRTDWLRENPDHSDGAVYSFEGGIDLASRFEAEGRSWSEMDEYGNVIRKGPGSEDAGMFTEEKSND